jgi:two-component system, response regulator, stage 0 sporulation protein F
MRRILMIGEDPSVQAAALMLFEHEGFDVCIVESAAAGLSALDLTPFDAVIVDILLPGADGFATIQAFRALNPALPIVAISGFMDLYTFRDTDNGPGLLSMAAAFGAVRSVPKPFRPHDLLQAVQDSLCLAA